MQSFFFRPQTLINKYGTFHYFAVEYGWLKKMYTFKKKTPLGKLENCMLTAMYKTWGRKQQHHKNNCD